MCCAAQSESHCEKACHTIHDRAAAPMARLKCSISTSVFFTSEEYTSDPTIGQKGTCAYQHSNVWWQAGLHNQLNLLQAVQHHAPHCSRPRALPLHLRAKLLGNAQRQGCLARARGTCGSRHGGWVSAHSLCPGPATAMTAHSLVWPAADARSAIDSTSGTDLSAAGHGPPSSWHGSCPRPRRMPPVPMHMYTSHEDQDALLQDAAGGRVLCMF